MTFRDQSFATRFAKMGDEAETIFAETYPEGWSKYGLDRPPVQLKDVPAFVRFTPDMLTRKSLVEIQGFGRDQTAKFKNAKLDAVSVWHGLWRVDWFLWDTKNKRYGWVRHHELLNSLDECGWADAFDDGRNPYRAIKADDLPVVDDWVPYDPNDQ
jgi:hypothetical protein